MILPLKALSLTRPWPYTILHLGKGLENRRRQDGGMPPMCKHRGPLLLHSAQSWDDGVLGWCTSRGLVGPVDEDHDAFDLTDPDQHPTGIVGRCNVVGHIEPWDCSTCGSWSPAARVNCTDCEGTLNAADGLDLRWWMGGYALILRDVVALPQAVPTRGYQGIWDVRRTDPRAAERLTTLCAFAAAPCWCGAHPHHQKEPTCDAPSP